MDPDADIELSNILIVDISTITPDNIIISWLDTTDQFTEYEIWRKVGGESPDSIDSLNLFVSLKLESLTYSDTSLIVDASSESTDTTLTASAWKYFTYSDSALTINENYY